MLEDEVRMASWHGLQVGRKLLLFEKLDLEPFWG